MRINHNISAMNAHRLLNVNNAFASKSLEKLSSGKRINRAGDDAAGMAITEKMRAQINGLKMASRNSLDGVSLVQTAEGAMGEVHSMLQRMRELSVQAANGTMSTEDRQAVQDEINQLTSEVNRIANGTEYNTRNILRGNEGPDSNTTTQTMSTGQPAIISGSKDYDIKSSIDDLVNDIDDYNTSVTELKNKAAQAESDANAAGDTTAENIAKAAKNAATTLETAVVAFKTAGTTFKGAADTYATVKDTYLTAKNDFEKAKLKFDNGTMTSADFKTATDTFKAATDTFNTAKGVYDTAVATFDTAKTTFDSAVDTFKTNGGTFEGVDSVYSYGKTLATYSGDLAEGYKGITKSTDSVIISENLQNETLAISVNGEEVNVNLGGFTGIESGLTINDLLNRINESITDGAEAILNENGEIEIKTLRAGGEQVIELKGSAVTKIFGGTENEIKDYGMAENPAKKASGSFYFDEVPEKGSKIQIGNETIEFYDSSIEPYSGSNRAIDIYDGTSKKSVEQIVKEIAETMEIDGVSLSVETPTKALELRGDSSYSSKRLIIEAEDSGFEGNLIYLEGTLGEFNTNLQVGPNSGQNFRLLVSDIRGKALKISAGEPSANPGVKGAAYVKMPNVTNGISSNMTEYAIDVTSEEKASAAIKVFDNAIVQIASERSKLGATQNRLEHTIANLDNTSENLTAAMSRIEDTDMALEMANYQKLNVLQQAGVSMLAQANQQPQSILKLLG